MIKYFNFLFRHLLSFFLPTPLLEANWSFFIPTQCLYTYAVSSSAISNKLGTEVEPKFLGNSSLGYCQCSQKPSSSCLNQICSTIENKQAAMHNICSQVQCPTRCLWPTSFDPQRPTPQFEVMVGWKNHRAWLQKNDYHKLKLIVISKKCFVHINFDCISKSLIIFQKRK
jgi:hypothetical protein